MATNEIRSYPNLTPDANTRVFAISAADALGWVSSGLDEAAAAQATADAALPKAGGTMTGDIQIDGSANGLILQSPDLSYWRITVDNSGALSVDPVV